MGAASISTGGFSIANSCLFNTSDNAVLSRANGTATSTTTATIAFWFKIGVIGVNRAFFGAEGFYTGCAFLATGQLYVVHGNGAIVLTTTQVFRDPSAWYHCVCVFDTTESTTEDRFKMYINGVQVTAYTSGTFPTLNEAFTAWNQSGNTNLVGDGHSTYANYDGYLSEFHSIDGTAYGPTTFGEFDSYGVWRPIEVSAVTYGNNGFYMDFKDSSNLGNDVSGNDNDLTSSGLVAADQVIDTPTKNYPTFASNMGRNFASAGDASTLSNGNLDIVGAESAVSLCDVNFVPLNTGKWYFTWLHDTWYNMNNDMGITNDLNRAIQNGTASGGYTGDAGAVLVGLELSTKYNIQSADFTNFQATIPVTATTSDQTVMAVDIDNLKLWAGFWDQSADNLYWLANDGSWSSANVDVPGTGSSETCAITGTGFTFFSQNYATRGGSVDFGSINGGILGNITTPSGFKEVNTSNLPTPTILDGTANFQTTLYTGNTVNRNISQTGNSTFTPDWVWIKNRSAADDHMVIDAARGVTEQINPDGSDVEVTDMNGVTAFSDKLLIDASSETLIGDMTGNGGLAAAFDGDNSKGYASSAQDATSPGYCGVDWGSGNTKTITRMITIGSSDFGYSNPGRTITINIEGSTDNFSSSVVDLGGGTGDFTDATGTGSFKMVTPTSTTAYRYHRAKVTTSAGSMHFGQVQFFEDNAGATRGFTLGNGPSGYNDNSENFAAWQWLAGGGAGSSNEDGTINTTTTTVNTTAGISIGTYTGTGSNATIGHGLGVAPDMVIVKCRNDGTGAGQGHWYVYHRMQSGNPFDPQTDYTLLNTNAGKADDATVWQDTAPTSTVFSIGTAVGVNESSNTYIYYAFADVQGFSKMGGYKGNGSAEGPLAFTGFKTAFVMIKRADDTGNWIMYDNQRSPYNEIDDQLFADTTAAETTGSEEIDFLANGFKIRTADAIINAVNGTYFYMSFGEYPFGGVGASPATAF